MWSIVYYEMKVRKLLSISGCRSWHGKDHYTPKTPCIPCSFSRRGSWRNRSSCCRRRSQRRIFPGSPRIFWGKHNDIPTYFSDLQCLSVCLRILSVSRITCFRVTELFFEYQIYISNFSWVLIFSSLQRTMAPVVVVPSRTTRTTMLAEPQSWTWRYNCPVQFSSFFSLV